MKDRKSRLTAACEISQVLTAIIAAIGVIFSVLFSQQTLVQTQASIELMKTQVQQEMELHRKNREFSINPVLQFKTETITLPTVLSAQSPVKDSVNIVLETKSFGKLNNYGNGIAYETVIEWSLSDGKSDRVQSRLSGTQIPVGQDVSIIDLPEFLTNQIKSNSSSEVIVYISCRNQDDQKSTSAQHAQVESSMNLQTGKGTLTISFREMAIIRWEIASEAKRKFENDKDWVDKDKQSIK